MLNIFRMTAYIFLLVTLLVFVIKPKIFFSQTGQIKSFGINNEIDETFVTLPIFIYGVLIIVFIMLLYINKITPQST